MLIFIFSGKYTQYGNPRKVADRIKKERNGEVEIYAIAVGEEKRSSGVDVIKEIASDIEGQSHFFWLHTHAIKSIIKEMISPGNCFLFPFTYVTDTMIIAYLIHKM